MTTPADIRQNLPFIHPSVSPFWIPAFAGMTAGDVIIYGQDVLYAAGGHACMDVGGRPRREQAVEGVDRVGNEGRDKSRMDFSERAS